MNQTSLHKKMTSLWNWSSLLNSQLTLRDKNLAMFMSVLVFIHAVCFAIESTGRIEYNVVGPVPAEAIAEQKEPNNYLVQVNKLRVNNIEKLMYLGASIGVFVLGANLGFRAADFQEMYKELNVLLMVYIASLLISFLCNLLCANTPPTLESDNGSAPTPPLTYFSSADIFNLLPLKFPGTRNQGTVSPTKLSFVFWTAQWLLIITDLIQTVLLSYFSFGLVGAYTSAYPFGLLARSLKGN
jgi:hypothetical protein